MGQERLIGHRNLLVINLNEVNCGTPICSPSLANKCPSFPSSCQMYQCHSYSLGGTQSQNDERDLYISTSRCSYHTIGYLSRSYVPGSGEPCFPFSITSAMLLMHKILNLPSVYVCVWQGRGFSIVFYHWKALPCSSEHRLSRIRSPELHLKFPTCIFILVHIVAVFHSPKLSLSFACNYSFFSPPALA